MGTTDADIAKSVVCMLMTLAVALVIATVCINKERKTIEEREEDKCGLRFLNGFLLERLAR
jgi:hypothetical protein